VGRGEWQKRACDIFLYEERAPEPRGESREPRAGRISKDQLGWAVVSLVCRGARDLCRYCEGGVAQSYASVFARFASFLCLAFIICCRNAVAYDGLPGVSLGFPAR